MNFELVSKMNFDPSIIFDIDDLDNVIIDVDDDEAAQLLLDDEDSTTSTPKTSSTSSKTTEQQSTRNILNHQTSHTWSWSKPHMQFGTSPSSTRRIPFK